MKILYVIIFAFPNYFPMIYSVLPFCIHSPLIALEYTRSIWFSIGSFSPVLSFSNITRIINFPFVIFNFLIKLCLPCFHSFLKFPEVLLIKLISIIFLLFFFICNHLFLLLLSVHQLQRFLDFLYFHFH